MSVSSRSKLPDQICWPVAPSISRAVSFRRLSVAAHAALEQRRHAELLGNGLRVDILALEAEGGGAGDDLESGHAPEPVERFLGEAVGEVLLLGIAAQVLERQHRDRRILGRLRLAEVGLPDQQHDHRDEQHADHDRVGVVTQAAGRWVAARPRPRVSTCTPCSPISRNQASAMATGKPTAAAMISAVITHFGSAERLERDVGDLQREPGDHRVARRHAQHAAFAQAVQQPAACRGRCVGRRAESPCSRRQE